MEARVARRIEVRILVLGGGVVVRVVRVGLIWPCVWSCGVCGMSVLAREQNRIYISPISIKLEHMMQWSNMQSSDTVAKSKNMMHTISPRVDSIRAPLNNRHGYLHWRHIVFPS